MSALDKLVNETVIPLYAEKFCKNRKINFMRLHTRTENTMTMPTLALTLTPMPTTMKATLVVRKKDNNELVLATVQAPNC